MAFWIIAAAVCLLAVWSIVTGNRFKSLEIRLKESLSGVETALSQRYDTLTKLLDTAKGYMRHEKALFTQVIALRAGMSVGELNEAERRIAGVSARIFAVAEQYPELRSSDIFAELQRGIYASEEQLQAARQRFNSCVEQYNVAIALFPASLIARGRTPYEFFETETQKRVDVEIRF